MNKNTPDLLGIKKQARDSHTGSREGREDYNPPPNRIHRRVRTADLVLRNDINTGS